MKLQPAVTKMFFSVPLVGNSFIDISQCASIVNRRFYRQGLNWAVAGFKIHSSATTRGQVTVFKIQDTWMASNAWQKGFALWNKMNEQVLDDQPSIKPKFHDFKIAMDTDHVAAGSFTFADNLIPFVQKADGTQIEYNKGEWTRSLIEMPNDQGVPGDTVGYAIKMHGADTTSSKALIQGYADSRSVPTQPDPVTQGGADTGWMNNIFDVGDSHEEIAFNLQTIGEDLPYDKFEYPGAAANGSEPQVHAIGILTESTVGGQTMLEGGNFQCGLVKIVTDLEDREGEAEAVDLELILVPGTHRGYLCEPMQEV
jgi:hypothetical protein